MPIAEPLSITAGGAAMRGDRAGQQPRAIDPAVTHTTLDVGGPALGNVLAGEVNHGIHPFEASGVDEVCRRIPGDLSWCPRRSADERADLMSLLLRATARPGCR